ncbi:DoxX family protein [Pontixanthobacter aquaemixtae]|uniref:DoxX family membrane protein n=1 Tax=Pontixanthobacter aquaemixtae TaxID=1958940 RepID=A0A844ZNX6_9SPHN|nr:DoxX family protein [Pontixanthobacter aquaemixtae]MXO89254.1 DoxX family membrane protein [Pontixanthobacter aquaemixtae]
MLETIDNWLTPSVRLSRLVEPVFRVMTSLIFIIGGLGHFGQHQYMLDRMDKSPWREVVNSIGDPSVLLWLSGVVFIIFGITLAIGFFTRLSALLILVTLLPITFFTHIAPGHVGPLFKNVAIMGALAFLWFKGGGAYALDYRWLKRTQ